MLYAEIELEKEEAKKMIDYLFDNGRDPTNFKNYHVKRRPSVTFVEEGIAIENSPESEVFEYISLSGLYYVYQAYKQFLE